MLILVVITSILGFTKASLSDISSMYEKLSNSTDSMLPDIVDSNNLRSFAPNGGTWSWTGAMIMNMIGSGYGCWCYFQNDVGKGKSDPIDELDEICKTLHQGYECAMIDNTDCTPYDVIYQKPNPFFIASKDQIRTQCQNLNTDQCQIDACTVETNFVFSVFGMQSNSDSSYRHDSGFDIEGNCPIMHDGRPGEKSCCGDFPDRFPYKGFDGERECCGKGTYDTGIQQCCDEAGEKVVRLVCS